jgi:hypothetical protein
MFLKNLFLIFLISSYCKAPFRHIKSAMWTVAIRAEFANAIAEEPIYIAKNNQVLRE